MIATTPWPEGISFAAYIDQVSALVALEKTSGPKQDAFLAHFTKLNAQRMKRLSKTLRLEESLISLLQGLKRRYHWRVFTEAWCGDAAQSLPYIAAMAKVSPAIDLSIYYRDEHPQLFDQYLTEGSRSIPKLVAFDQTSEQELGTWGPRPAELHEIVLSYKEHPEISHDVIVEDAQKWYNQDNGRQIQAEIFLALQVWEQI